MDSINSNYRFLSNNIQTLRSKGPSSGGCQSCPSGNAAAYQSFSSAAKKNLDPVQRRIPGGNSPVIRWARNNPQIKWVGKNVTAPLLKGTAKNIAAPAVSWLGKNVGKPVADTLKSWGLV